MSAVEKIDATKKILQVAEELFSEKGFNGTSVNMIAEKAGVNKALIYYYFKDKNDIVNSLFESIIQESDKGLSRYTESSSGHGHLDKIKEEINFLLKKQNVLSVMLMESLKGDDQNNYFFQCAESVIKHACSNQTEAGDKESQYSPEMLRTLAYEFFTGFVPIVSYVVFRDKWCQYFKCSTDELIDYFLDSFKKTHLAAKESKYHFEKGVNIHE